LQGLEANRGWLRGNWIDYLVELVEDNFLDDIADQVADELKEILTEMNR
jgi:hypothetical protein